jgi:hypothetical protein
MTSTSPEPVPSSSPPRSLCAVVESSSEPLHRHSWPQSRPLRTAIFPDPSRWCHRPHRPRPHVHDAIPEPATTSSSLSLQRCAPRAIPEPTMPTTHAILRPATPSSSLSLRHPEPMITSNPRYPWAHNIVVLPKPTELHCIFFFVILGLQILILICYIAFVLLHCFDVLYYHIALIYYIAFNMPHCFDMLHCF